MEKKFVCVNDIDFSSVPLVPVKGGYTIDQRHTWKYGIVFRFPKGIPERGRAVYVVFKEDVRMNYSEPRDISEGHFRGVQPGVFLPNGSEEKPFGKRTVVSIYDLGEPRPGSNLPMLKLAMYKVRETGYGARSSAKLEGKILFQAIGGTDSATGNHGERHVVFVAEEPVTMHVHTVSNRGHHRKYELTV